MRLVIVIALLLAFIPAAAMAGDCNSCGKSKSSCSSCKSECKPKCESKCDSCKPKCESKCSPCKPKCESKCNTCKPKCESKCKPVCQKPKCNSCAKPACGSCGKSTCNGGCGKSSCAMPCACMDWEPFCGCGDVTSLCISLSACDGTAGPLKLQLRDVNMKTIAIVELAGPIDGYYNYTYTFDTPVPASSLHEAVLINSTDDAATLTWLQVTGNMDCNNWTYIDKTCDGVVIGPGGCPRMVLF